MIFNNNSDFILSLGKPLKKDFKGTSKGIYWYNKPCSFDIETSSFYSHDNEHTKTAIMYVWQFAIGDKAVYGRTWSSFMALLIRLTFWLGLDDKHKIIIYVHNLSYEFQFIRKLFKWDKVFALEPRKVCYADLGSIEFRCSYLLSGYSLENLAKAYNFPIKKLELDYHKIRTPKTPLSKDEIAYCVHDVFVVNEFIAIKINQYKNIANIPLTSTGEVRKEARKKILHPVKSNRRGRTGYLIQEKLKLSSVQEFELCRKAFQGGFTHANAFESGKVNDNVASYDFTSSYPYVMVSERYPMSIGKKVYPTNEDYIRINKRYLTISLIEIANVKMTETADNILSLSRVIEPREYIVNNGRIVSLKHGYIVCTNIDFECYQWFYSFDYNVIYSYVYQSRYLPLEYIELILSYYDKKTTLKGVAGKEIEYMHSKQKLNSLYGMMVTNPMRDEILLDDEWVTVPVNKEDFLEKYNSSRNRFTFYPWGVFVTAYARRNLFTGIKECGLDYIYSDTDSIKITNYENHKEYFDSYNKETQNKIRLMAKFYGIDYKIPKTVNGIEKPLGVWDFEGVYDHFKTLGAKRYLYDIDGNIHLTVSGVNKKYGAKYLEESSKGDVLKAYSMFKDGLTIPKEKTGKNILTYIDSDINGTILDYHGEEYVYNEKSCIHMEETSYTMGLSADYIKYLLGIRSVVKI